MQQFFNKSNVIPLPSYEVLQGNEKKMKKMNEFVLMMQFFFVIAHSFVDDLWSSNWSPALG